ncbi:hypothetical protein [Euzebya sp.]|uniref:hypothetical protein n=1 Tax=Euzebya sp. TaxID=1971409 RepID=UPI003519354C
MTSTPPACGGGRRQLRRSAIPRALAVLVVVAAIATGCTAAEEELPRWATATARPAPEPSVDAPATAPGDDLRVTEVIGTEPVTVEVGPEDVSWSIGVIAPTADELVGIRRVVDPAGEVRYLADLRNELLLVDELHPRVLADAGAVGLYVTSEPGAPLAAGTWTVDVVANAGTPTSRVVVRSAADVDAAPQRLDVVVWATAEVPEPAALAAAWRAAADGVLGPHGMAIGRLEVVPAPEGAAGPFRTLGVDGLAAPVHAACDAAAEATGADPRTAVVVLSERIGEGVLTAAAGAGPGGVAYRAPDGDIEGYAVATPGTPVTGPASHACVAVSAGDDPTAVGLVALHEVLHQAGITRHTTERTGRDFDRLADTPECPLDPHDADGDLEVTRAECTGLDADNLMFWAVGGTALTDDQAWRIRRHPLLHPEG